MTVIRDVEIVIIQWLFLKVHDNNLGRYVRTPSMKPNV